ncbi:glycoside hydrolase family 65 protein [Lactobacillus mulieris]|uniref:Glycoside hydrolase family 65 protein n=2 Tax=Lactobacillus mulieris TaxID=2508708 RepID=A0AAW5WYA7_9LACO|nr:glycoside hydrolase family 65 protein [Lactobacillus mulieris]MCZ3622427.1 glycoside hydrolase family 65 protein [Lactobacillus mulieris]MCZ3624020.1 glycoside hydrolase family 65 protein [Lactobacillus mulieris]MCZ3636390.1 glycoside hydrolase family 65 protein [Lactobacillus mulieris]MCZ3690485.1 glycoside hydrolase family 65 protein [Lactobacillus mulieris]MCZ3695972.1 glycoside hydrolase family 65 protein [Lactobacillus mulieris]
MKRIFEINPWNITTHNFPKEDMRLAESITSIGNDYMGMRGNFEEGYSGDSLSGTYLAGVWFPDKTRVGWWKNGYPEYFGKSINAPSFIGIQILVDGEKVDLAKCDFSDYYQNLDMHQGLLTRSYIYHGKSDIKFTFERFLSNRIQEAALIKLKAQVLKGSTKIAFISTLDGNVVNEDSNYEEHFWKPILEDENEKCIQLITKENPFQVPQFTVLLKQNLQVNGERVHGEVQTKAGYLAEKVTTKLNSGEEYELEKDVIVITSRDVAPDEQLERADLLMHKLCKHTFSENLAEHEVIWQKRWNKSDVQIKGSDEAQQGIRFNIFQLFMTYYGQDARLNIGPKGFTGEKYGGATYWDTEAYIIPMYLAVAPKEVTRALLEYRHRQLPGAYHNAKEQGLKGALFPMVTFNGIECHNEWEITFEEIHRNADIPFAIYQYTEYTGDESYVQDEGMDVLVGTARFWADRVHYSKRKHKYMIHGVTGPNEYENNVNNNWFTNQMAVWLLSYTLERLPKAKPEALKRLTVSDEEKAHWQDIIDNMYFPEDKELGIFVQHDTFLDKDIRPVSTIPADERPINQHWSWDKILRSPFIKQADVLQGIYFLNNHFTKEQKEKNFDFYEPLTVHESSLSACIHAILAAELGKQEKAVELYQRTARLDLDNYNNDTSDGLHITSMSGSWLAIVQGFAGMRYYNNQLSFKPFVPRQWQGYSFKMNYRGRLLEVAVSDEVKLRLLSGPSLKVKVYDQEVLLEEGQEKCLKA